MLSKKSLFDIILFYINSGDVIIHQKGTYFAISVNLMLSICNVWTMELKNLKWKPNYLGKDY